MFVCRASRLTRSMSRPLSTAAETKVRRRSCADTCPGHLLRELDAALGHELVRQRLDLGQPFAGVVLGIELDPLGVEFGLLGLVVGHPRLQLGVEVDVLVAGRDEGHGRHRRKHGDLRRGGVVDALLGVVAGDDAFSGEARRAKAWQPKGGWG